MLRILKPEVFQGSLKRKRYFEGWYFKQVSEDLSNSYAFIPGISLNQKDKHAFIQVINGMTGKTDYISYPLDSFHFKSRELNVRVGQSVFTDKFIDLNIEKDDVQIKGRLEYSNLSKYPSSILAPGIMGWYSYVPFMECYHGVVSANHSVNGSLLINNHPLHFTGGKGYIEKDWGRSFPESWIWMQSNSFEHHDQSIFLSIAKIPWLGKFFIGFIAFVYRDGEFIRFTTYNGSKLTRVKKQVGGLRVALTSPLYDLEIDILLHQAGELVAPVRGEMNRMIKESIDSEVRFMLKNKKTGQSIEDHSLRAGLEIIEGIFNYF